MLIMFSIMVISLEKKLVELLVGDRGYPTL